MRLISIFILLLVFFTFFFFFCSCDWWCRSELCARWDSSRILQTILGIFSCLFFRFVSNIKRCCRCDEWRSIDAIIDNLSTRQSNSLSRFIIIITIVRYCCSISIICVIVFGCRVMFRLVQRISLVDWLQIWKTKANRNITLSPFIEPTTKNDNIGIARWWWKRSIWSCSSLAHLRSQPNLKRRKLALRYTSILFIFKIKLYYFFSSKKRWSMAFFMHSKNKYIQTDQYIVFRSASQKKPN